MCVVYCLFVCSFMSVVCCLLFVDRCLVFGAFGLRCLLLLVVVGSCVLFVACFALMHVGCFGVCCLLFVGCQLLIVACRLLCFVVFCCCLFIVACWFFVVCWRLLFVVRLFLWLRWCCLLSMCCFLLFIAC